MEEEKKSVRRLGGLRSRWLMNTVGVVFALGMVCVLAVTASFAAYYYSNMESDLRNRAQNTTEFFADYINQNYNEFYQSCIVYAQTFEDKDRLELQFINRWGNIVASSFGPWAGESPSTPDIQAAVRHRGTEPFVGRDTITGERIMAVSCPLIYSNGEVIGVLRYVTSTRLANRQIFFVGLISFLGLLGILAVVVLSSGYYVHSILTPVQQITEKAKRIASGSYGTQIQTRYDDEIGELAQTINEMSTKISQNEKMQAEFISQLSHELRTPLTVINGWSETLLAGDQMDADTRQGMKIISSEAKRLTEMVMELLDFTRMQDGRMTLNVEPTDIRENLRIRYSCMAAGCPRTALSLSTWTTTRKSRRFPAIPSGCVRCFSTSLTMQPSTVGTARRWRPPFPWTATSWPSGSGITAAAFLRMKFLLLKRNFTKAAPKPEEPVSDLRSVMRSWRCTAAP